MRSVARYCGMALLSTVLNVVALAVAVFAGGGGFYLWCGAVALWNAIAVAAAFRAHRKELAGGIVTGLLVAILSVWWLIVAIVTACL